MVIQNLTASFSGSIRRERVGKTEYIVAPIVMIVPGVLPGSQGALLYPANDVAASAPHWDNVILTDGHLPPLANGKLLATRERYGMGFIQNARYRNGKLCAEGWFDIVKTKRINWNIYDALISDRKLEVSTGLNVDYEDQSGVFNGRSYSRIARNYRPDHLAILTNERGACGLDVGCGCNVNNAGPPAHGDICLCSSCLNIMGKYFKSEVQSRELKKAAPVGGQLVSLEVDWSDGRTYAP